MRKAQKSNTSTGDDGYFDDCPICQAMKKKGIKMHRYPDEDTSGSKEGIWEDGFYATPVDPNDIEEIKDIFRKNSGTVIDDDKT